MPKKIICGIGKGKNRGKMKELVKQTLRKTYKIEEDHENRGQLLVSKRLYQESILDRDDCALSYPL